MRQRVRFGVLWAVVSVLLALSSDGSPVRAQPSDEFPGLRVVGRHLYDRYGDKVVLVGVNKMVIWTDRDGLPAFPEIAKTGANAVRIVWLTEGPAYQLDTAISNAIEHKLIPVVDCHDSTGDWDLFGACIDYWLQPDVLSVLKKHEEYLILNIANEPVENYILDRKYRAGYELAIKRLRAAGIHVPLVVDAQNFGQGIDNLQKNAPYLIEADPDHNLIFSIHIYWASKTYGPQVDQLVIDEIRESVEMDLPLIVGEFANVGWQCACCIPYKTIIEQCHLNGYGYFAWSWGPGNRDCKRMDMTQDGRFDTLQDWGLEVALTDPHSIKNIAVRPDWIVNATPVSAATPTPTAQVTPKDDLPDLVVTEITWEPAQAIMGGAVTFRATVSNQGGSATPDGAVHRCLFQVNGETVAWSDGHTASIAPGESVTLVANGGPDGDATWTAEVGDLIAFAWVDDEGEAGLPQGLIQEGDELNNMATAFGQVLLKAPAPTRTRVPRHTATATREPEVTATATPVPAEPATPMPLPVKAPTPGIWVWIVGGVLVVGAVVVAVVLVRRR